jgi:hypothetical protein
MPKANLKGMDVQYCTGLGNWITKPGLGSQEGAYPMAAKLSDQAIATRFLAKRARRLAGTLTIADDATRLLRYADDLEAEAAHLDRRAKEGG